MHSGPFCPPAWPHLFPQNSTLNTSLPFLSPNTRHSSSHSAFRTDFPSWFRPTHVFLPTLSLVAQLVKNLPAMQETWVRPWVGKTSWGWENLPTPVFWPREFHGLYNPWGSKESDTTDSLFPTYLTQATHILLRVLCKWGSLCFLNTGAFCFPASMLLVLLILWYDIPSFFFYSHLPQY